MAFDWSHPIAKRICDEGVEADQGVVPWNRKISKIEKFIKILTPITSEAIILNECSSLTRISLLAAFTMHVITLFVQRLVVFKSYNK